MRADNYMSSAIRIENIGNDTPIAIYVASPNGGWAFVKALSLPKGGEQIITGDQIVKWASQSGIDLAKDKNGRFGVLVVASPDICGSKSNLGACCEMPTLNVYAAQQVRGTDNVRYVPVKPISGLPLKSSE